MNTGILENAVRNAPLSLLLIKDEESLAYVNSFLPYSVGFEIETNLRPENKGRNAFTSIPNIMDADVNDYEDRFRIPNGIAGLLCLYNITVQLRANILLNYEAAIHYHIDMTDCFDQITDDFITHNNDWIIDQLAAWKTTKYSGRGYCSRDRNWVRYASEHKTLEIRLGEMSFDYPVLINRIIECCDIVRRLKAQLNPAPIIYTPLDRLQVINYIKEVNENIALEMKNIDHLTAELRELSKEKIYDPDFTPDMLETVKKRVVRFSP